MGWGGWGDVNVHVNLRHQLMLRTRRVGGWGDVNVHDDDDDDDVMMMMMVVMM